MYKDYKIIVSTAAGRRQYMQYLVPLILATEIVDRYDIWVHTNNLVDIEFFKKLHEKYSKVNLIWQPRKLLNGNETIDDFYQYCTEEHTIYVKIDDDIIWAEDDFITKMVEFRIQNKECFIVSPLVINNALSTYCMQVHNKIFFGRYYNSASNHKVLWKNGYFAASLHEWFINNYLKTSNYADLYCGKCPVAMIRFSINCILWFGEDMKQVYKEGGVHGDDEEYLSSIRPTQVNRPNAINGDVLISHYAFYKQRKIVDNKNILNKYGEYINNTWNNETKLSIIYNEIQNMIKKLESYNTNHFDCIKPYSEITRKKSFIIIFLRKIADYFDKIFRKKRQHFNIK